MDGASVNGGNADEVRENSNLEMTEMPEYEQMQIKVEPTIKMECQEVNGDIKSSSKKSPPPVVRRKLRKFKANSTSTIESDTSTKGRKRKLSEPDDVSSEESMEFNGFDVQGDNEMETGSHVLRKLIGIGHCCYAIYYAQTIFLSQRIIISLMYSLSIIFSKKSIPLFSRNIVTLCLYTFIDN